jgi:hypothetical protein
MLIPISGLHYHTFEQPIVGEVVYLVKEPENAIDPLAVALYNELGQRMGYVSSKFNQKVFHLIANDRCSAKIWWIFRTFILVEHEIY